MAAKTFIAIFLIFMNTGLLAAESTGLLNSVNLSLGASRPAGKNSPGTPARFNYGLGYERAILEKVSVGAFISRNKDEIVHGSIVDFSVTRIGATASYKTTKDSYVGIRAGLALLEASASVSGIKISATPDTNPFFVGPTAGIIIPVTQNLEFLPSLNYDFVLENNSVRNFGIFDAMATLRYHF